MVNASKDFVSVPLVSPVLLVTGKSAPIIATIEGYATMELVSV